MADQVAINLPKTQVLQGSAFTATATFRDRATGASSTPSTVDYKLYNVTTGSVTRNWTAVTPGATVSITVGALANDIQHGANTFEKVNLIVAADRGMSTEVRSVRQYTIRNVPGLDAGSLDAELASAVFSSTLSAPAAGDLIHAIDVSDTTASPSGTPKLYPLAQAANIPGSVLNFGADSTGVADSTQAFQDAEDSDYAVYVPNGTYRIDGTITIIQESNWVFERGLIPNFRHWASSTNAPYDHADGEQVRLFKDNSSSNVPFFVLKWGYISLLGFPIIDVSEDDDYTADVFLYTLDDLSTYSSNGRIYGWGGRIEAFIINDRESIRTADNGPRCVKFKLDNAADANSYFLSQEIVIYGHNVHTGLIVTARSLSVYCNSLDVQLYLDGFKQAVNNIGANNSNFGGFLQARNTLDATEFPTPCLYEVGIANTYDMPAADLSSSADSFVKYRPSYYMRNEGRMTVVNTPYETEVAGEVPRGSVAPLTGSTGIMPWVPRNGHKLDKSLVITQMVNQLHNMQQRATTYTWKLFAGDEVESTTAVSDCVFSNQSGASVDITSAGGNLPTLAVGAIFEMRDHSDADNNGRFEVTAVIANGYTCDKLSTGRQTGEGGGLNDVLVGVNNVSVFDPNDAVSEAVNVFAGYEALITDSDTAGITDNTSAELTVVTALESVTDSYGNYASATFSADAVTDEDYLEVYIDFNVRPETIYLAYTGGDGFKNIQLVTRTGAGVVADQVFIDSVDVIAFQSYNLVRFQNLSDLTVAEVIIRFIGPREASTYTFLDIASMREANEASNFITAKGGQTIYGSMTHQGYTVNSGGTVQMTATSAELIDEADAINTGAFKRLGAMIYNTTTKTFYVAQGSGDNDTWVDCADGTTTITPAP